MCRTSGGVPGRARAPQKNSLLLPSSLNGGSLGLPGGRPGFRVGQAVLPPREWNSGVQDMQQATGLQGQGDGKWWMHGGLWALGLSSRSEEGLRGLRSASHWGS